MHKVGAFFRNWAWSEAKKILGQSSKQKKKT